MDRRNACIRVERQERGKWGDEWVAGKMGSPASEDQDHCWRET